jgi:hypothetical protein
MPIWGCIGGAVIGASGPGDPDCGIGGAGGFPSVPIDTENIVQAFNSAPGAGNTFSNLKAGNTINSTPRKAETIG